MNAHLTKSITFFAVSVVFATMFSFGSGTVFADGIADYDFGYGDVGGSADYDFGWGTVGSNDYDYGWGTVASNDYDYGYGYVGSNDYDFGYGSIGSADYDYGYGNIYGSSDYDYGYGNIYDAACDCYGYTDSTYYTYGYDSSYSYPSYSSYGISSYPVSVGYGVPVGHSVGGYTSGSYSYPVTVASGRPVAHPTTLATPTSIANVDNSINIVDNSINDSFNTTTIMNSFNSGSGTVTPTYHAAPSCTISVTGTFGYGQTLTWHTYNANSASISSVGAVTTGYGTRVVYPTHGQTFVMTVSGQGGTATCQTASYAYAAPVAPTHYGTPYVSLSQIPYTGFDFGPVGNALYWAALVSIAAAGAYLVVFYRGGVMAFASGFSTVPESRPVVQTRTIPSILEEVDLDDAAIRASAQDRITRDSMSIDLSYGTPRLVIARQ